MSKKVLIVNSDSKFVKELHSKLKENNLEGLAAYDGIQAVKIAIEERPDIIVLEAAIKGGGGIGTLKNLRTSSVTSLIPVIFIADPNMKNIEEKIMELGVEVFIDKPISLDDLLVLIGNILGGVKKQSVGNVSLDKMEARKIYDQIKGREISAKKQREKKLILIVDDEADILETIGFRLGKAGYEVIEARDGMAGLTKARQEVPDLIVLDLMLPKLDGYKICRMLKFDKNYQDIPIIMFTARAEEADKIMGKEVGADAYITKPFEPGILLSAIEKLLKK